MADKKEAAYIVGYLEALKQIRRDLADGYDIADVLDRLEVAARASAERHGVILLDEQAKAKDE